MEVRRTAPVKLVVPNEYYDDLHETAEQFLYCANRASDYCWDNTDYEDCITSNAKARDALYDRLREETDLTANLVQEAIRRAVHAVDSGVDRWKNGKRTNKPAFSSWSMVYDRDTSAYPRPPVSDERSDAQSEPRSEQAGVKRTLLLKNRCTVAGLDAQPNVFVVARRT